MLRLMNGVFANRLNSMDFCFERLSACKCRSSQKPLMKDYSKAPFAGDLGPISEENTRLLDLMKLGCHCPKNTIKGRWFYTNQHIILSLATVLERPPTVVSEFLYSLTLQNFSKIMYPGISPGSYCKVPFVFSNACEDYMRLFDTHGNIRSRFSQDSLKLLIRVIQTWLKNGSHKNWQPFRTCFPDAECKIKNKKSKAEKAGIDRDSIARQNGLRRLRESDERAHLSRSRLKGSPGHLHGLHFSPREYNDFSAKKPRGSNKGSSLMTGRLTESEMRARFGPFQGTFKKGDPGYVFGIHFAPNELDEDFAMPEPGGRVPDDQRFGRMPSAWPWSGLGVLEDLDRQEDDLAAERSRRLESLLFQLNQKTFLTRDMDKLISALKDINLEKTRQDSTKSANEYANDSIHAKGISDSYYENVRESGSKSRQKRQSKYSFRKSRGHIRKGEKEPETDGQGSTGKSYYGAPIPVLVHEPYSRDKPWTYMRRHPHQKRMTDKGDLVSDINIRRYRRETVDLEMQKARANSSVHTVYSMGKKDDGNVTTMPMFGQEEPRRLSARNSFSNARTLGYRTQLTPPAEES